ncbi:glycohydrolase toxin TNT-related protein [Agromyces sp. MMS24-JH15]|uniref:TNT domain-containing protein n=1 Tax=Agromyces sp. MMS24-JH15 TaxID=3243765 RepID=UPI0037495380
MAQVKLDPARLVQDGDHVYGIAQSIDGAIAALESSLRGLGGMAGDDDSAEEFCEGGDGYDAVAGPTIDAVRSVTNGLRLLDSALSNTARSYDGAQKPGAGLDAATARPATSTPRIDHSTSHVPSALGPGWPGPLGEFQEFLEWGLHQVGVVIPTGDEGKLQNAADAWGTFAGSLRGAKARIDGSLTNTQSMVLPQRATILSCRNGLSTSLERLTEGADAMKQWIADFRKQLRQTREELGWFLRQMAIELAADLAIGGLLSIVTAGIGALATAAKATSTVMRWCVKIAQLIMRLKTFLQGLRGISGVLVRGALRMAKEGLQAGLASGFATAAVNHARRNEKGYTPQDVGVAFVSAFAGGALAAPVSRVLGGQGGTGLRNVLRETAGETVGGAVDGLASALAETGMTGNDFNPGSSALFGALLGGGLTLAGHGVKAALPGGGHAPSGPGAPTGVGSVDPSVQAPTPAGAGAASSSGAHGGSGSAHPDASGIPAAVSAGAGSAAAHGGGVHVDIDAPSAGSASGGGGGSAAPSSVDVSVSAPDAGSASHGAPDASGHGGAPDVPSHATPDVSSHGSTPDVSSHATPDATPSHGATPDATPSHGATPDATPSHGATPDATPSHGSTPNATPSHGSTPDVSSHATPDTTSSHATPDATPSHGANEVSSHAAPDATATPAHDGGASATTAATHTTAAADATALTTPDATTPDATTPDAPATTAHTVVGHDASATHAPASVHTDASHSTAPEATTTDTAAAEASAPETGHHVAGQESAGGSDAIAPEHIAAVGGGAAVAAAGVAALARPAGLASLLGGVGAHAPAAPATPGSAHGGNASAPAKPATPGHGSDGSAAHGSAGDGAAHPAGADAHGVDPHGADATGADATAPDANSPDANSPDANNPDTHSAISERSIAEIDQALGQINPHYDPSDPMNGYATNCGNTSSNLFDFLNGNATTEASTGTLGIPEMEARTNLPQTALTSAQIESSLRAQGAGSHVVVGIDRAVGDGHWFNAYFDGTTVWALDAQTGTRTPWPPHEPTATVWDASIQPEHVVNPDGSKPFAAPEPATTPDAGSSHAGSSHAGTSDAGTSHAGVEPSGSDSAHDAASADALQRAGRVADSIAAGTDPMHSSAMEGPGWTKYTVADLPDNPNYGTPLPAHGTSTPPTIPTGHPVGNDLVRDPAHPWGHDAATGTPLDKAGYDARYVEAARNWDVYPPNEGAVAGTRVHFTNLRAFIDAYGRTLDRVGPEGGDYLGLRIDGRPASFEDRGLPIGSLAKEYHQYKFTDHLPAGWRIEISEIAPAFGRDAGGLQLLVTDEFGDRVSVEMLLEEEVIV